MPSLERGLAGPPNVLRGRRAAHRGTSRSSLRRRVASEEDLPDPLSADVSF
jgi:hypothetical protein